MTFVLARNWWSLVIRGLVAILVGVITFIWPGITLGALILLFGAYALLDGIFAIIGAWKAARAHERWGALVFEGIAGIGASAVTVVLPGITALVLVYVIAAWAVVTGSLEIMAAMRLRKYISGEWLLILSGVASILFGILAIVIPLVGARDCVGVRHLCNRLWSAARQSRIPSPKLDKNTPYGNVDPLAGSLIATACVRYRDYAAPLENRAENCRSARGCKSRIPARAPASPCLIALFN
jgi:uncharacterized membrane protein HdeD (DUF308 family)